MSSSLCRAFICCTATVLLTACGEPQEREAFVEGPKGYVEFFIPGDDPLAAELHADAQIYLLQDGKPVFKGMTLKWKNTAGARHGLVVAVPPGTHTFSVEVADGATPVNVSVVKDMYQPVRITSSGIASTAMLGMTKLVQFRIEATVEAPQLPGAGK